ncbi:MAG: LysM peptidoglycan-binding domain-containing protein [Thermoanaerobaculia bacterium]
MLVVFALTAVAVRADDSPPKNLKLVGDHWTPWDPPSTFPEGAEVYTIERGDTLWDLSGRFYSDPYLWPQLWERNRYILDAHWIYPGDPLVVGFQVTPLEQLADVEESAPEEEPESMFDTSSEGPMPLGVESDIYCSGFIGEPGRSFPNRILGSEYQNLGPTLTSNRYKRRTHDPLTAPTAKVGLYTGDVVYLEQGRAAGITPGTVYSIVQPSELVHHPDSGALVGQLYRYMGRVRVLSVQESSSIAEIVFSCDAVNVGASLEPFEPEPVPLRRRTPMRGINDPEPWEELQNGPSIVLASDEIVTLGQNHIVYIDAGSRNSVEPGDMFTVYRRSATGLPPMVVGEVAVLAVHESSSVARILESRYSIYVGDKLSPKDQ